MVRFEDLNDRFQREFPKEAKLDLGLRLRRSLSWLERSLQEKDDDDVRFILCWIAFNAAYGADTFGQVAPGQRKVLELEMQERFFHMLVKLDKKNRIHCALWEELRDSVQGILQNEYIYYYFWRSELEGNLLRDWRQDFKRKKRQVGADFRRNNTARILVTVFERVYVLRNQILHGGATWRSSVNRDQVIDGANFLSFIIPLFLEIMMSGRNEDWGKPSYPVIE